MNTKELIASKLSSIIDSLDQEAILKLLETLKTQKWETLLSLLFLLQKSNVKHHK